MPFACTERWLAPPELRAVHPLGKSPEGRQSRGTTMNEFADQSLYPGLGDVFYARRIRLMVERVLSRQSV